MPESTLFTSYGSQFLRGRFRHFRPTFYLAGQDSFSDPPAQSPDLFEALTNVMPSVRGALQRRWGYKTFAPIDFVSGSQAGPSVTQIGVFQDDVLITRRFIFASNSVMTVTNEDGSFYFGGLFQALGAPLRMLASRSYTYFASGKSQDLRKWNGGNTQVFSPNDGVTKWGIDATATMTSVLGPNPPGTAAVAPVAPIVPPILPPIDDGPINPIRPINPPLFIT